MKKWVEKLIEQFDFDWKDKPQVNPGEPAQGLSEETATLLFLIDTYNKHLIEIDGHPVRKTREALDDFAKELIQPQERSQERVLFRFRQFFSAYRIDECAYFQKTFEDFRTIIWDFVDQLAEDLGQEQKDDSEIHQSLEELKEAVESNSIQLLKNQSRKFIDCYVEKQFKKDKRRSSRMKSIRKNLLMVKKQLGEANDNLRLDHLTGTFNRKCFEEYGRQQIKLSDMSKQPLSMIMVDIDYFKRVNDTYGHDVGDFVLKELVNILKSIFLRDADLIARLGGEEFAIVLPDFRTEHAIKKAEEVLARTREAVFVQDKHEIRFTVSMGVAQVHPGDTLEDWLKRADQALYQSKNTGRNRFTVAEDDVDKAA